MVVLGSHPNDTLKILCDLPFFIDIEVFCSRLSLGEIGARKASIRIVPLA